MRTIFIEYETLKAEMEAERKAPTTDQPTGQPAADCEALRKYAEEARGWIIRLAGDKNLHTRLEAFLRRSIPAVQPATPSASEAALQAKVCDLEREVNRLENDLERFQPAAQQAGYNEGVRAAWQAVEQILDGEIPIGNKGPACERLIAVLSSMKSEPAKQVGPVLHYSDDILSVIRKACAEPSLVDALTWIAIWENDRAVKQARDNQQWETCFKVLFARVLEKYPAEPPFRKEPPDVPGVWDSVVVTRHRYTADDVAALQERDWELGYEWRLVSPLPEPEEHELVKRLKTIELGGSGPDKLRVLAEINVALLKGAKP